MAQSDAPPQKAAISNFTPDNGAIKGNQESHHFSTREIIKKNFEHTRDLNVVQIQNTILYKPGDDDKGATPFIQLMDSVIGSGGRYVDPFEAKWLVSDSTQLQHVIRETKARNRGLFNRLAAHATVVVVEASSTSHQMLTRLLHDSHARDYKAITAFPSNTGDGYDCYGNFAPPASRDWKEGSLCTLLDSISAELKEVLMKLHQAHVERVTGGSKSTLEGFENNDVLIMSLENLIA